PVFGAPVPVRQFGCGHQMNSRPALEGGTEPGPVLENLRQKYEDLACQFWLATAEFERLVVAVPAQEACVFAVDVAKIAPELRIARFESRAAAGGVEELNHHAQTRENPRERFHKRLVVGGEVGEEPAL